MLMNHNIHHSYQPFKLSASIEYQQVIEIAFRTGLSNREMTQLQQKEMVIWNGATTHRIEAVKNLLPDKAGLAHPER